VLTDGPPVELTGGEPNADDPVGVVGTFLYDPCGAVIRSQLLGTLASQLGANTIADQIAYLSSDSGVETPFAQRFSVREVLPLDQRTIAQRMKELGIGTLEIKKRGVDIDPAQFRTKLKLSGPNSATLILTRIGTGRGAILADRA
jgi:hypothetical protein